MLHTYVITIRRDHYDKRTKGSYGELIDETVQAHSAEDTKTQVAMKMDTWCRNDDEWKWRFDKIRSVEDVDEEE